MIRMTSCGRRERVRVLFGSAVGTAVWMLAPLSGAADTTDCVPATVPEFPGGLSVVLAAGAAVALLAAIKVRRRGARGMTGAVLSTLTLAALCGVGLITAGAQTTAGSTGSGQGNASCTPGSTPTPAPGGGGGGGGGQTGGGDQPGGGGGTGGGSGSVGPVSNSGPGTNGGSVEGISSQSGSGDASGGAGNSPNTGADVAWTAATSLLAGGSLLVIAAMCVRYRREVRRGRRPHVP